MLGSRYAAALSLGIPFVPPSFASAQETGPNPGLDLPSFEVSIEVDGPDLPSFDLPPLEIPKVEIEIEITINLGDPIPDVDVTPTPSPPPPPPPCHPPLVC